MNSLQTINYCNKLITITITIIVSFTWVEIYTRINAEFIIKGSSEAEVVGNWYKNDDQQREESDSHVDVWIEDNASLNKVLQHEN